MVELVVVLVVLKVVVGGVILVLVVVLNVLVVYLQLQGCFWCGGVFGGDVVGSCSFCGCYFSGYCVVQCFVGCGIVFYGYLDQYEGGCVQFGGVGKNWSVVGIFLWC